MAVKKQNYGVMPDGTAVDKYILSNGNIVHAEILTLGGVIDRLFVPDKYGNLRDILLGFDSAPGYLNSSYQGAVAGPYANRIKNGSFSIGTERYQLPCNEDGINSLHSNREYTDNVWEAEITGENAVTLKYFTPDGKGGFPGNVNVSVTYTLEENNSLRLDYRAATDKATLMNPTNHAYFNLSGYDAGTILDTLLQINASYYTPVDENKIPYGEIAPVKDTPFSFVSPTAIGERIDFECGQLKNTGGYDHNYCIDGADGTLRSAAAAYDKKSGISLEVLTTLPGIQFYAGNFLNGAIGKNGKPMGFRTGFCLETQYYPDSPNHPNFPSCVLRPGEEYKSTTVFCFNLK